MRLRHSLRAMLLVAGGLAGACGDSADAPEDDLTEDSGLGDDAGPMSEPDAGTDAGSVPALGVCGNARLDPGEECDDGNDGSGDGCDGDCRVEAGFHCTVAGADCEECGNGIVESSEACDDANRDADDGCSPACEVEGDWVCPVPGQPCELCGNGVVEANERCDEGDFADGIGCSEDCRSIDASFDCVAPGEACVECGDGAVDGNETCDDGNVVSGDGCVFNCSTVEPAWRCAPAGGGCTLCGDGSIDGDEECDDGNFVGDDGCSVLCEREPGSVCFFPGVLCSKCGNGFIEFITLDDNGTPSDPSDDFFDATDPTAREECDDGNQDSDDGCSADCELEDGGTLPWLCPVPGLGCGRCGDEEVQDIEICDDGVDGGSGLPVGGDGCSDDCTTIEPNYTCPATGGDCEECGDGSLEASLEECDDANALSGDGCNRWCEVETDLPWACFDPGTPCELCGNGIVEDHEACDDGDRDGGDGCSADCQTVEDTYNCFFGGFPCARCGDGSVSPGEKCDEGEIANPSQATDGCDDECQVVSPWVCPIANASCEKCGDAIIGTTETCEDGNAVSGDGCSSLCQLEQGFDCGSGTCLASACGDGFAAGEEECDDGNSLSGDGCSFVCDVEDGWTCAGGVGCRRTTCGDGVVEGEEACDDGNTASTDGCDAACAFEPGYTCPVPDAPCVTTTCGDSLVEGYEQCDDGDADPLDGCDADCRLEADYKCPDPGLDCVPITCGDGLVEGLEACDDGSTATGDGCDGNCAVETLYRCEGEPSECSGIVEFVVIQRFTTSQVSPVALNYDPERRAFAGHKASDSQPPVELCLDGSLLDPTDTSNPDGSIVAPDGAKQPLPPSCAEVPQPDPCYAYPPRPVHAGSLVGSAYDPFTDHTLFLSVGSGTVTLTEVPRGYDEATQTLSNFQVELSGLTAPAELTVGEDGDLYVAASASETVVVFPRRRDANLDIVVPDCEAVIEPNCTSFVAAPDAARGWSAPTSEALEAIFTVPGEGLIGVFNTYEGAPTYTGMDLVAMTTFGTAEHFSLYDPALTTEPPLYGRSGLPGLLFDLGERGTSYDDQKYAKAAETAADGGAFILCPTNPSAPCQLFARTCLTDADCASIVPGTECETNTMVPYCHSPGAARDDAYQVDRDSVGQSAPVFLDVLANDSRSESACLDPEMTILSVCGDGVQEPYEAANAGHCPDDTMPPGTVTFSPVPGGDITYDAPDDGSCGFAATFTYTVDLGGGVIDTATVRVVVACICGDGVVDSNEQCDLGADNAPPGTLLDDGGTPDPLDDVYARCGTECFFNLFCSDGYIVAPEECDDRNTDNGDGCSTFCTLESVCGNGGAPEGVEECDDGNTDGGDDCNPNCTIPKCGDGNVDVQAPFGETCDDGNLAVGDGCDFDCQVETICGNGVAELGEDCDDGNIVSSDGCSAICTIENVCGNDITEGSEECDGPDAGICPVVQAVQVECTNEPAGAPNICLCANYCGDGMIGGTEDCDDGEDGSATCRGSAPAEGDPCTDIRCGDGFKDGTEQCDDGNTNPADGCTNDCKVVAICGNGTPEGAEECDDGNNVSGDGCSSACKDEATVCGDGVLDFDEQCDDGNTEPDDGCDPMCLLEGGSCGDGTVDLGEECDDGNTTPGDGCSASCKLDLCGNGTVNNGEECDDGNTTSGDGCSSLCRHEVQ